MQIQFLPTPLDGAFVLEPQRIPDDRGFFALAFHADEFRAAGLSTQMAQVNISYNDRKGTLRGMHFQVAPKEETKVVRCVRGAVFDVIIDLRPGSPTRARWFGVELTADNRRSVYVPKGFAHGYQTLTDDVEVSYFVSEYYSPAHYRGVRWNDPAFGITWPLAAEHVHHRDASYPDFSA